jgi:hypothetical protein
MHRANDEYFWITSKSLILICVIGGGVCVDMQFDMKQNYRNCISHCNSIRVYIYTSNISPHMFQIQKNIHGLALLQYSEIYKKKEPLWTFKHSATAKHLLLWTT